MKAILSLALLFISFWASAEQKTILIVEKLEQKTKLPDEMVRQLDKMTLMVAARQSDYELGLTRSDSLEGIKIAVHSLETFVTRDKETNLLTIKAALFDLKKRRIMRKVQRDNIHDGDLLRLMQAAVELVFKEKDLPDEEVEKEQKPREKKTPEISALNPVQKSQIIDFKKRVQELKGDVDAKIAAMASQNSANKVDDKKDGKEGSSSSKKNNQSNQNLSKASVKSKAEDLDEKSEAKALLYGKSMTVHFVQQDVVAKDLVEVSSKLNFLIAGFQGGFWLKENWGLEAYYLFSLGRNMSSVEQDVSLFRKLGGGLVKSLGDRFHAGVQLAFESALFINVPEPGAGLQAADADVLWGQAYGVATMEVFGQQLRGRLAYGVPSMVRTGYAPLQEASSMSGSRIDIGIELKNAVKMFDLGLSYSQVDLSTQGARTFSYQATQIGLAAYYSY